MTRLNFTCLLLGNVALSLCAAAIPASANDSQVIPVEAVAPLESPTGTVRDLGTIPPTNGMEWNWEQQESEEKNTSGAHLELPETITPNSKEVTNPHNATLNEGNWGNVGEMRRRGATLDLTEF